MIKAGLLGAVFGFIYTMAITLFSPFCTVCFTPLLGLGVGYLAGWADTPASFEASLRRSAVAGGITGLAVIVGQMAATLVNGVLVTNAEQLPKMLEEFGLGQFAVIDSTQYWQTTIIANSICSVLNLVIVAGLGALGGLIWFQRHHKTASVSIVA